MEKAKKKWVEEIERSFSPKKRSQEIPLTIIIPTYNCSAGLDHTLSTIVRQNYHPLEVIIVDAGSTDKTHTILAQYGSLITRVYSVAEYDLPEMINRGAALATGDYLTTMLPSCFYISAYTFDIFAEAVEDFDFPDLITCDAVLHASLPILSYAQSWTKSLKKGLAPAAFISCWFKTKFFIESGKLNPQFKLRFALDLFCRISKMKDVRIVQLDRTLVDHSSSLQLVEFGWGQLAEIRKILKKSFGWRSSVNWIFELSPKTLFKLSFNTIKEQIFEKS
ncbi:MAG: hypothetical protein S4CHLAM81_06550 [Chlamydiales bacterium]|nr:hypothetical protein [Chlamydiales bacterium]MCH9635439.1 hypothetical protein [Chlamydiales bacterium]